MQFPVARRACIATDSDQPVALPANIHVHRLQRDRNSSVDLRSGDNDKESRRHRRQAQRKFRRVLERKTLRLREVERAEDGAL